MTEAHQEDGKTHTGHPCYHKYQ